MEPLQEQNHPSNGNAHLVPLFIPTLAAILRAKEDAKGTPLTEEEVLNIRDEATVMMVSADINLQMEQTRGYRDINPENCWQEWQELRKQF